VQLDQHRGYRRDAGVALIEVMDEFAAVAGGADEPKLATKKQRGARAGAPYVRRTPSSPWKNASEDVGVTERRRAVLLRRGAR
jgi:hypothetical protein